MPASLQPSREVIVCSVLAAASSSLAVLAVPPGGDLAAHLYRTDLVRHGFVIWDNLWFAGQYPLSSYSLLYYLLAALIGNAAIGIAGVVAAAAAFASIVQREWHLVGRWPGRAFAILLAGQAFTAAYPYDLGLAAMLATLAALQRRRLALAVCTTLLTLGFSPLAFVFLVLALVALGLARRRIDRQTVAMGAAATLAGGVQLAVLVLLPAPGLLYPYGAWRFASGLVVVALGVALALRGRGGWRLASLFVVWAFASVICYLVPSPVGHNLVRASVFLLPLMFIAASLAGFRPRWLAVSAITAGLAANVLPYAVMISVRSSSAGAKQVFWRPVLRFLNANLGPDYRVEVVPTANHWEADFLPDAGLSLARGWYRQLDMADNPALYQAHLTAHAYQEWLRRNAVRFVVLPHLPLEAIDAEREARLLRSPSSGLREVWTSSSATIFRLTRATPLITGPGRPRISRLDSNTISGRVTLGGTYFLRVHFTPYWSTNGSTCVQRTASTMTRLIVTRAGPFTLRAVETPLGILHAIVDDDRQACRRDAE